MAEMLDIFDEHMCWIGVRTREEVHREGHWHQTFQCWFVRRDGDETYVYFQRRHETKADFPGLLDITAAGHIGAGETREDGFREAEEELGVRLEPEDVHYLGCLRGSYRKGGFIDREFCHVHLYRSELPNEAFRFQDGEVSALVRVKLDDARRLIAGETEAIEGAEFVPGAGAERRIAIGPGDIVPHERAYYEEVFEGADRLFESVDHREGGGADGERKEIEPAGKSLDADGEEGFS